jgi:uncharacterized phage protein (TIGR02216 family)
MGIAPSDFWRLSLKEWRGLIEPCAAAPVSRAELAALMQRFPDLPP